MRGPKNRLGRFAGWRQRFGAGAVADARRQEALATLAQHALEGAESTALLAQAAALVARILDVPYTAVFAWEPNERQLRVTAGVGWRAGVVGRAMVDTAALPETAAAWSGLDPVSFEALDREPRMAALPLLRGHEVVSGCSVAIAPRGRPYGVLAAYTQRRRRFQPAEVEFMRGVARLLAVALGREYSERALFEEMKMSTVLAHVGRELMSCTEATELLSRSCQLTAHALRCDHSVTWLRSVEDDAFRPVAADGLPEAQWESLGAGVLPNVAVASLLAELAERETVRMMLPCERHPLVGAVLARSGIRCAVFAPLHRGEKLVGLQMSGHRDRAGDVSWLDERVAVGIAQLVSMALMKARVVEELERASQLKSEFVSTMSHELRTPLNIIIGYTDMLRDAAPQEEQALLLAQVRKASHELLDLIDGTLNLNRLAAGGDIARFAPVALAELWRDLEEDFTAVPRRSEVALRFVGPDGLDVQTDRRKLKIVVKNLIGNALKFTAAGEVVVTSERVGDQCRITVRDTGIGIAADALPHMFEMFRQADSSETRSYGGAGLGLYIVKSLVTQLGGRVQAESVPGQGSVFTIVLPLTPAVEEAIPASSSHAHIAAVEEPARPEPPAECAVHTPRRLLFADDLPLNRLLVQRFIAREFAGVEVIEACDGEQAVTMFATEKPHLVLLDLHMPNLDGWQTARTIRRCEGGLTVPILALSVDASPGAEGNAVRAGFQEFIAKPISDYSALKSRLEHWLTPRDRQGNPIPPTASPTCAACRGGAKRATAAA